VAFAVAGLAVLCVIDADGDPTTPNGPPVVLTSQSAVVEDESVTPVRRLESPVGKMRSLEAFLARAGQWLAHAQIGTLGVRPIRGP
jgi:hypothetical protein